MAKLFIAPEAAEARYKRYAKGTKIVTRTPGREYCAEDGCPVWAPPSGLCRKHERALLAA